MTALVTAEYLESLEETIAVATDPELVVAIAEGEAEPRRARASRRTKSKLSS